MVLQRAVRRWLKVRRGKMNRRKRGFMSCHGVVKMCGLTIAFVMLANARQNEFTLTVKEQNAKELSNLINKPLFHGGEEKEHMFAHTVINKHKLS
jgi:hypothetical protein